MANSVDPDQMPNSAASDLSLHYSLRPVYPNINYGNLIKLNPRRNHPGSAPETPVLVNNKLAVIGQWLLLGGDL